MRVQDATLDSLHRCAAACGLRAECTAFSLSSEGARGVCTLHGALHAGLIPQLRDVGEFAPDPRHQVKARPEPTREQRSRSAVALKPSPRGPRAAQGLVGPCRRIA